MHPQIRKAGPGSCPICGMALEPEAPAPGDAPNPELVDFTRRLWVSGVLSVPLLLLSMGTGTDLAIESAGMTLTKGDLSAIVRARRLSAATMRCGSIEPDCERGTIVPPGGLGLGT